jgi:hypothetical protein
MFLVYLYGRKHSETTNAYPIVEPHHFIAYEEGVENKLHELPTSIDRKLRYGEDLDEVEEELSRGLSQMRIDSRRHPRQRTHPLDERHHTFDSQASSTSTNSSYASTGSGASYFDSREDSPTKRPISEYRSGSLSLNTNGT